jgi:ssDNA-binding Zn-finger/Zn-ribbon topoisomerase 1
MKSVITFRASGEQSQMATDFWAGSLSFGLTYVNGARRVTCAWEFGQAALCTKYEFKNLPALRKAQALLGHPELPDPLCRDCAVEVLVSWRPFSSRQDFIDFVDKFWANARCKPCAEKQAIEQARIMHERAQRRLEEEKQRKADSAARREKLKARYGAQYVKDCPECEGVLYLRAGRYHGSIFIACSGFPSCKHREPMLAPVPRPSLEVIEKAKAEIASASPCPKCGSGTLRRVNGIHGPFIGCNAYPNCRYTESIPCAPPSATNEELVGRFE